MPLFIKKSFIYTLLDKTLINPYNTSLLKKVLGKISNCFKQSFIYKSIQKYLDKKPYFLNSIIYKFIRKIIKIIDKIMDFLHKKIKTYLLGSNSFIELRNIKYFTKEKKLLLLCILLGAFNLSYSFIGIIFNTINLYISYGLLIITIILYLFSRNTNCFKESFIYKIFKSW
ncbi:hypothetical protein [[Clostridium] colinum]|uniref:hypothetical protein n=1 Tax=[Clostridium] colinum TaxID=36835 RepID=UPI00202559E1|nr:hypothetical protein [[Clostridium] colinum]